jgi:hypothetical protein
MGEDRRYITESSCRFIKGYVPVARHGPKNTNVKSLPLAID